MAIALTYKRDSMGAPQVVAKGRGVMADRILELAQQHHVPVKQDKFLMETLDQVGLGQQIPAELYQAVAEVLVAVYRTESGFKKQNPGL